MRRNRFKIAVALGILLPLTAGGNGQERQGRQEQKSSGDESDVLTIGEIMIKAHQPGRSARKALDQRVIDGRATDDEKRRLLALYEALAKAKPEEGSLDDWKRVTKALVEAAQGVVAGQENAAEALKTALNCKACHEKFRPVYGADGSVTADRQFFAASPPPEFALVANVSKDRSKLKLFTSRIVSTMVFQDVVVESEGKKRTEKVPEMRYQREASEVDLAIDAIRVVDGQGNEVAGDDLWRRLAAGNIVLYQESSEPVAKEYLKLLASDALVITQIHRKDK